MAIFSHPWQVSIVQKALILAAAVALGLGLYFALAGGDEGAETQTQRSSARAEGRRTIAGAGETTMSGIQIGGMASTTQPAATVEGAPSENTNEVGASEEERVGRRELEPGEVPNEGVSLGSGTLEVSRAPEGATRTPEDPEALAFRRGRQLERLDISRTRAEAELQEAQENNDQARVERITEVLRQIELRHAEIEEALNEGR